MNFDYWLHSVMGARRSTSNRRWWRRPTTFGGVAIFALSATAAGAVTSSRKAPATPSRSTAHTYQASAWPDLVQRKSSLSSTPPGSNPAPASPVVGAADLCESTSSTPSAHLTAAITSSNGTTGLETLILSGLAGSLSSTGLSSVLPTITGTVSKATDPLGLPLPTLPTLPVPTTVPSGVSSTGSGIGGTATSGKSGSTSTSTSTTTTTTTQPPSTSSGEASSGLSQSQLPAYGASSTSIGCNLIGTGTVGGMAPGETAAESAAVEDAIGFLGVTYVWGGESPQTGFDCSGLVQYVYREVGISLPRVAQDQYDAGPAVPPGTAVEPGDLVFFGSGPDAVEHVGMYVGDGLMVDAPHTGSVVRFDRISSVGSIVGVTAPGQG
jgi:cell wall-associated NlpC family hydrolase